MSSGKRVVAAWAAVLALVCIAGLSGAAEFKAGFAKVDITPTKPTPMWGYGARHNALSQGVRDPLFAKALVLEAGANRLALVGLDLGRGPTEPMMANIRRAVKEASGIEHLMLVGSHTHHGPVIELKDEPGKGKGVYDDAVAYTVELEKKLIDVINEAATTLQDARIGWGSEDVPWNRNRQTKIEPKPVDPELAVVRVDDASGKPIAILVNFAAHPTNLEGADLRFSAEYPGEMMNTVEAAMGTNCLFMQGAAGDLSCNKGELNTIEAFGKAMGEKVVAIAQGIQTEAPAEPSIQRIEDDFAFPSRVDFTDPNVLELYKKAFFPELMALLDEFHDNTVRPHLTTVLVNKKLALVGGSGEFFCSHSLRLKERARGVKTLFFGYCNGHHMYFPTIEATAEGGYGCDPAVSWVALGAGEEMMNRALINIYTMLGVYEDRNVLAGERARAAAAP
jgi:neutral ceramidase